MAYLIGVTLLWAFSFSLIGVYLAGQVDSYFAVLIRVLLACAVFLPFLRFKAIPLKWALRLSLLGAIQLGVMYLFFYRSFLLISVPEVLLFTVFTPIYVTLLYDLLKRRFSAWYLVTAAVAVLGAAIIRYNGINEDFVAGFLMVQGANICFAIGQVGYKYLQEQHPLDLPEHQSFGLFYLGALAVAIVAWIMLGGDKYPTTTTQWAVLLWLGLAASGAGYFLWNKGATQVDAGALAIMNNLLVPAGLIVNIVIWNRDVNFVPLAIGGSVIMLSLLVNELIVKPKVESQLATS